MSEVRLLDDSKNLSVLANDNTNGLGILHVIRCTVTEELNGIYECQFDIPIDDKHYSDIHAEGIFTVKPSETKSEQMFRIYHISKPMNGIATVSAHHISYDLSKAAVVPCEAVGVSNALYEIKDKLLGTYPFNTWTDIVNTSSKFSIKEPRSFRACLGGVQGSILDTFGGEYEWDNLLIKLHAHRGLDNGVSIEYGKNLIDIKQEENIENTYNAVVGYATVDEGTVTGDIQYAVQTSSLKTMIIDFSSEFDYSEIPTVERINELARAYIENHNIGVPNVNITVKFVPLWQTEEYKNIAPLERVALGDTVHVKFLRLGVEASAKVIKTVYNVLLDRYDSVEIGNVKSSLSRTLAKIEDDTARLNNELKTAVTTSVLDDAIDSATSLITGGLGGHVIIGRNAAGEPEEILIMDTADKETATQVIRINQNGIGFGTSYNGPFTTAWTIDGGFNANFINSGTIQAINIIGSLIQGSSLIFGDAPNTTELRTNDAKTGALFNGSGVMEFNTVGRFNAVNKSSTSGYDGSTIRMANDSNNSGRNYLNLMNYRPDKADDGYYTSLANSIYVTANNTESTGNTMRLQNYQWAGSAYTANQILLSGTSTMNNTEIQNYLHGTNSIANSIRSASSSASNVITLANYENAPVSGVMYTANNLTMQSTTSSHSLSLANYKFDNGSYANYIYASASSAEQAIAFRNYAVSTNNYANYIMMTNNSTANASSITIANNDKNGNSLRNQLYMVDNATTQYFRLANYAGTTIRNSLYGVLTGNNSEIGLHVNNSSGSEVAQITCSSDGKLYVKANGYGAWGCGWIQVNGTWVLGYVA